MAKSRRITKEINIMKRPTISSDAQLKALKPEDKFYYQSINETGLYIRVAHDSSKKWYYIVNEKTDKGWRKRYLSLKRTYPSTSLEGAKILANTLNMLRKFDVDVVDILKNGFVESAVPFHMLDNITVQSLLDMGLKRIETKEAEIYNSRTVKEAFEDWYETYVVRNRTRPKVIKQILNKNIYPNIGSDPITSIDRVVIRDKVLQPMFDEGHTGEKVYECLKQAFNWMERVEPNFSSPIRTITKKDIGIKSKPQRKVTLTMDEIVQFLDYLDNGNHIIRKETIIIFKLILLTGQRTADVLRAPWSEFDFENKLWAIPANRYKIGHISNEDHIVPMSAMVTNLFLRLKDNGHPTTTQLLDKAPARALKRLFDSGRMPFEKTFTPHDLRRTFATRMVEDFRYNETLVDMILGHKQEGMKAVYQTGARLDERREALNFWADKISKLVEAGNQI